MNKIEKLFCYAGENVEFYKGISLANFGNVSKTSKEIIKDNYNRFLSDKLQDRDWVIKSLHRGFTIQNYVIEQKLNDNLFMEWTTGSSGVPFRCIKSAEERKQIALNLWKRRMKIDKGIAADKFFAMIHTGASRNQFDIRDYSKENIKNLYQFIKEKGITCIHTTPNLLKKHIYESGLPYDFFYKTVPYIEVTGHYLSEEDKKLFEEVFGAKMLNMYGLIEVWGIAYTCERGHLHVIDDNVLLEILDEKGEAVEKAEEVGQIVVTALNQFTMPFIRYKTGDYGKYVNVNCDSKGKVIELCRDREINYINIDGKRKSGLDFAKQVMRKIYWKQDFPDIANVCIVQKNGGMEFEFILNRISNYSTLEEIARTVLKEMLGREVKVNFNYVTSKEYEARNPKGYLFINKSG